jgi:hypothetical protein
MRPGGRLGFSGLGVMFCAGNSGVERPVAIFIVTNPRLLCPPALNEITFVDPR